MPDVSYDLFDTAQFLTTVPNTFTLFQVAESGDPTHLPEFTNSRGAGQLPQVEKFSVDMISVFPVGNILQPDVDAIFQDSWLELNVNNKTVLRTPLRMCVNRASFGGAYTQAAAANAANIGIQGDGRSLKIPVLIPGGTPFKVVVKQTIALAVAKSVRVVLSGTLSMS